MKDPKIWFHIMLCFRTGVEKTKTEKKIMQILIYTDIEVGEPEDPEDFED